MRTAGKILWAVLAVVWLAACGGVKTTQELQPLTVQLRWYHQASAAGNYAAWDQGYYADQGLDVSFLPGGPEVNVIERVLSGEAQFGVTNADTFVQAVGAGKPLVAVAVIFQRSPVGFMVLEDSDIYSPRDFVGKNIRAPQPVQQTLATMMAKLGIEPGQYTILPDEEDLQLFYDGSVQVWGVFVNNVPNQVRKAGYKIRIILPDDYGVHVPGDVIFTTQETLTTEPEIVRKFVCATLDGWSYALEHPQEASVLVGKFRSDFDPEHELQFLLTSLPLINPSGVHPGEFDTQVWDAMIADLTKQGSLPAGMQKEDFIFPDFVQEYYAGKID